MICGGGVGLCGPREHQVVVAAVRLRGEVLAGEVRTGLTLNGVGGALLWEGGDGRDEFSERRTE